MIFFVYIFFSSEYIELFNVFTVVILQYENILKSAIFKA